jgi:HSP20 family molecular chaperone IbpA
MTDIDILLKDLNDFVKNVINIKPQRNPYSNNISLPISLINLSVNLTTHSLEESISNEVQEKKLYRNHERNDPVVDVIENKDQIRIIVMLPGIKNEDVWFDIKQGILTVEIIKYGQILKKEIQCNTKPGQVFIKSSTVNNSVLELVFDKA